MGLLGENHHKIGLIGQESSIKSRCCPPFVDHFLHSLIELVNLQLAIEIGQNWRSLQSVFAIFLNHYYE